MEINGKNPLTALGPGVQALDLQQPQQPSRAQESSDEAPQPSSDRIELSVQGLQIQHLNELIQSTPDVRESKVEQIRSAIQSGTYNVKAEKIADKILNGNLIDEIV